MTSSIMKATRFVLDPERWPRWPLLPMKRTTPDGMRFGFMVAGENTTVYVGSYTNSLGLRTVGQLKEATPVREEFESLEKLLETWRID